MKRRSSTPFLAIIIGVLFLLTTGCTSQEEGGALSLDLSYSDSIPEEASRTILPDVDMEVSSYSVTLNGPNGEIEEVVVDISGMTTIENLHEGDWTITANARNISDGDIGSGQNTVTIVANETASCTIEVTPYNGDGIINLTFDWNTESVDSPSIELSLTPPSGLPFDNAILSEGVATYQNNSIPAGYYTLVIYCTGVGI